MKAWDGKTGWPHRHTVQRFVCLVFQHDCVDLTHYCAGVTNHWLARFSRFQSTRYKTSNTISELWPRDLYELLKLAVHETSFVPRVFVFHDQRSGNERAWKEWKSGNLGLEKSYSRPQRPDSFWSAPRITTSGMAGFSEYSFRILSQSDLPNFTSVNRELPMLNCRSWCWPC